MQFVPPPQAAPPVAGGKGAPPKGAPPPVVAAPAEVAPPTTHWSIAYSTTFADVEGDATEPRPAVEPLVEPHGEGSEEPEARPPLSLTFDHNFMRRFRVDASHAGLQQLINSKVVLKLIESGSGAVLASVPLDMLPFAAEGRQQIEIKDVQLEPLAPASEGGPKASSVATH